MKTKLFILTAAVLLVYAGYVIADESKGNSKEPAEHTHHETEDSSSTAVEVGNKICPVSGEKVGEMGEVIKYEYNGKIYNFCCEMCIKDFKKDPEKYSKIAEEEAKKVEGEEAPEGTAGHTHDGSEHDQQH